jgi:pyridoxamine 5'-phosphate oxidase
MNLADLRRDYKLAVLDEAHVDADPIRQFERWFDEARKSEIDEANAMALATASKDGRPSNRIVLLKEVSAQGFTFFTDYRSAKGRDLAENPRAALCFHWKELERQVRIEGSVSKLSVLESTRYFVTRPLESRLGAWASVQSALLTGRAQLEQAVADMRRRFAAGEPPLPPHWGGFRVAPAEIEFWQGRPNRLHDRLRYERGLGGWKLVRLSP